VYAPQIRVRISSRKAGVGTVDISDDLIQGSINIRTNGVHTFNFQLQNAQRKYDTVIQPMDRIVVEMYRVSWVRVFSGYLNNGPIFSAWPRVLNMTASCTLKRLQYWYWDSSTTASSALLNSLLGDARQQPAALAAQAGQATPTAISSNFDQSLTNAVNVLLTTVVQWPAANIHVAALPASFYTTATALAEEVLQGADLTSFLGDFTSTVGYGGSGQVAGATAAAPSTTGVGGTIGGVPITGSAAAIAAGTYGGKTLTAQQVANAQLIYNIAASRGLPQQAAVIAIATALQESSLTNDLGGDRDSAGLFQQRPSQGWGTYAQVTDPTYATNTFYNHLVQVPNYTTIPVTVAAQTVQRSAYPNAYANQAATATALVAALAATGSAATPALPGLVGPTTDQTGATVAGTTAAAAAAGTTAAGSTLNAGQAAAAQAFNALLSIYQWGLNPSSQLGEILAGPRAMMNDEPILPYIANLLAAAMRSWCSAPNGDFIAWFPDYFGIWNTAAKMVVQPIELMDFTVDWVDQEIVTHQYVVGTPMAVIDSDTASVTGSPDATGYNWILTTSGIATMDFPNIFNAIFGEPASAQFITDYLSRFGARPNMVTMPIITQGAPEFFMALYLFMQHWANQFQCNIPMTFMPELWPGMLLTLPTYGFQAYVQSVTHTFQFGPGGGFYTSAQVCAPARTTSGSRSDVFGLLPLAGSANPGTLAAASGAASTTQPSPLDSTLPAGTFGTGGLPANPSFPGNAFGNGG
jgi:hypothetical protein